MLPKELAKRLLPWYRENARELPWRATRDPYRIWISEIMLQQTRVEAVIGYYERFLERLPDVAALAAVSEEELLKLWEGLGYYSRARNLQRAARLIVDGQNGLFPTTYEGILALPGVGEYTAGAIASFAFDLPYPAVDGNVLRVAARLSGFGEDILAPASRKLLTAAVAAAQPPEQAADFNQAMIELGATVCLPNGAPRCESCPLAAVCRAHADGTERELPVRKKKAARRVEDYTVLILRAGDRVAIRKRPQTGLLSGLFEPFLIKGRYDRPALAAWLAQRGISPLYLTPLGEAKHIFTHVEWQMTGFEAVLDERAASEALAALDQALFLAERHEIDENFAIPSAFFAFRAYL